MSPYDNGKYNPHSSVDPNYNASEAFDFRRGQEEALKPRATYSDNGESFAKGVHGFFGMIYEFIKAPLFGKLIWLMGFGVILNGCAVGLVTFQQGETYGLQRFGILLVIGSVLIYFLRKNRFRVSIFSVLVVALFYWSYRIVADDIAKKESIANQR